MPEVGLTSSVEMENLDDAINVSELSDFDLFQQSFEATDPMQAEQIRLKNEKRQETLQEIEAWYGDEIISYHGYKDTAANVAEICPAAQSIVALGFEAFRDWVEANRTASIEEEDPAENSEESDDLIESSEDDTNPKQVTEKTVEKQQNDLPKKEEMSSDKIKGVVEDKIVVAQETIVEPQSDKSVSSDVIYKKKDEPKVVEKPESSEVVKEDSVEIVIPMNEVSPVQLDGVNRVVQSEITVVVEPTSDVETVTKPILDVIATTEPTELIEDAKPEGIASEIEQSKHREEMFVEVFESEVELNLEAEDDVLEDIIEESLSVEEIKSEQKVDEVYEFFEYLSDAAKEEPSLEDFFIEMIDVLDSTNDDSTVELAKTTEIETDPPKAQDNLHVFMDLEEIEVSENEEVLEAFDQELRQEARIELVALLVSVKSARKSVELLFEAKTKEECMLHLSELKVELILLLQSLGYENAETIVRDFLKSHSPQALKNLINELEKSLRRSAYRTAHAKQAHRQKTRHARLGKFIQFIMQAVTSRQVVDLSTS